MTTAQSDLERLTAALKPKTFGQRLEDFAIHTLGAGAGTALTGACVMVALPAFTELTPSFVQCWATVYAASIACRMLGSLRR